MPLTNPSDFIPNPDRTKTEREHLELLRARSAKELSDKRLRAAEQRAEAATAEVARAEEVLARASDHAEAVQIDPGSPPEPAAPRSDEGAEEEAADGPSEDRLARRG